MWDVRVKNTFALLAVETGGCVMTHFGLETQNLLLGTCWFWCRNCLSLLGTWVQRLNIYLWFAKQWLAFISGFGSCPQLSSALLPFSVPNSRLTKLVTSWWTRARYFPQELVKTAKRIVDICLKHNSKRKLMLLDVCWTGNRQLLCPQMGKNLL